MSEISAIKKAIEAYEEFDTRGRLMDIFRTIDSEIEKLQPPAKKKIKARLKKRKKLVSASSQSRKKAKKP